MKNNKISCLIILLILLNICLSSIGAGKIDNNEIKSAFTVIDSNNKQILINVKFPDQFEKERFFLTVPPDAKITPEIIEGEFAISDTSKKESPAQKAALNIIQTKDDFKKYRDFIKTDKLFSIADEGFIRFNRIISIEFKKESVSQITPSSLKIKLSFDKPFEKEKIFDSSLKKNDSGFSKIFAELIKNSEDIDNYASKKIPVFLDEYNDGIFKEYNNSQKDSKWFKVKIESAGYCRINNEVLKKVGLDFSQINNFKGAVNIDNSNNTRIFCEGKEIQKYVYWDSVKETSQKDSIIFYAKQPNNQYSKYDIYWINISSKDEVFKSIWTPLPRSDNNLTTFSHTKVFEQDNKMLKPAEILSEEHPQWVWDELSTDTQKITFDLPYLTTSTDKSNIDISFIKNKEYALGRDEIVFKINDNDFTFKTAKDQSFSVDSKILKPKDNNLEISLKAGQIPQKIEASIYLDSFKITYPREFHADNGQLEFSLPENLTVEDVHLNIGGFENTTPILFERNTKNKIWYKAVEKDNKGICSIDLWVEKGASYFISDIEKIPLVENVELDENANLRDKNNSADYVIISYKDFIPNLKPLIDLRESQGYHTKVVDVQDIYDEFNYGIESPFAIKYFLTYAMLNWEKYKPENVLLVGDATSDYIGAYRNDIINYVPSYTVPQKRGEEWASDYWFTLICGKDSLGDFNIGRLSARTPEEVQIIVDKIIHYETKAPLSQWRSTFGYVADDENYDKDCEELKIEDSPPYFISRNVYQHNYSYVDNFMIPDKIADEKKSKISPPTTYNIREMFNTGALYVNYYGHGSPNIWSTERIWFGGDSANSDNLMLDNIDYLPFIVTMTCSTGAIDFPNAPWNICISEDMMRVKNGGSVAMLVPTGPYYTDNHKLMSKTINDAMFNKNFRHFGDITSYSKIENFLNKKNDALSFMLLFLGDPAQRINLPDELFDLETSQKYLEPTNDNTVVISGNVKNIRAGKVNIVVQNPLDNIYKKEEIQLKNHKFTYNLSIPKNAEKGRWKIRAYIKDNADKNDAAGGVDIFVDSKLADIRTFFYANIKDKKIKVGESAKINLKIKNMSSIPIDDLKYKIIDTFDNKQIQERTVAVPANEYYSDDIEITLDEPGIHNIEVSLLNYYKDEKKRIAYTEKKSLAIAVLDNSRKVDPAISNHTVSFQKEDVMLNGIPMINAQIYNLGIEDIKSLSVRIEKESGTIIPNTNISLANIKAGESISITLPTSRNFLIFKTDLYLVLDPHKTLKGDNVSNNKILLSPKDFGYTNLEITKNSISFIPEVPTEGHTVFIHVKIRNKGTVEAKKVKVLGYIGDPQKDGTSLTDMTEVFNNFTIPVIGVGEVYETVLRWDPIKNKGNHNIYITVKTDRETIEINPLNNVAYKTIKIKSKAKFKPQEMKLGTVLKETVGKEMPLIAKFKNIGETDGEDIAVIFFKSKEQTEENEIGRIFIKEVKAGEVKEVPFNWQYKEGELTQDFNPSFQVGFKSSTQRVSNLDNDE